MLKYYSGIKDDKNFNEYKTEQERNPWLPWIFEMNHITLCLQTIIYSAQRPPRYNKYASLPLCRLCLMRSIFWF